MTKIDVLNYLSKHFQEFHNKYNVEKIGLFGSYARDEATESSDIDIFVQMHPKLLDMIAIKQFIEEDLHQKVDIVRLEIK
jgi:predicted nucleotidyltransferase